MIDELQKAFALAVQQSEQEQAAIAARIQEMIEADTHWDALLSDPESLDMVDEMAEEAHQEYLRGDTDEIGAKLRGAKAVARRSRQPRRLQEGVTTI